MINNEKECWICKKEIGKSGSEHHLFNFYDFKQKMIDTFELDRTFDKKKIRSLGMKWRKVKLRIPTFKVHPFCHRELEKRLRNLKNKRDKIKWKKQK